MANETDKAGHEVQDRIQNTPLRQMPGAHLLKPLSEIKGSNRVRLMATMSDIETDSSNTSAGVNALADFMDALGAYAAKDQAEYEQWTIDHLDEAIELCLKMAEELGKGSRSTKPSAKNPT